MKMRVPRRHAVLRAFRPQVPRNMSKRTKQRVAVGLRVIFANAPLAPIHYAVARAAYTCEYLGIRRHAQVLCLAKRLIIKVSFANPVSDYTLSCALHHHWGQPPEKESYWLKTCVRVCTHTVIMQAKYVGVAHYRKWCLLLYCML